MLQKHGKAQRLSRTNWTDAGLAALEQHGFTAIRADRLAKSLNVSRGSFYWHFANVAAFENALIERWRDLILNALEAPLLEISSESERLHVLLTRSMNSTRRVETAMRAWATSNPRIKQALDHIDAKRLKYMEDLVRRAGASRQNAPNMARIAYWSYLGHTMAKRATPEQIDAVVTTIVAMVVNQSKSTNGSAK
jgi:AcrR family transcriptional regulator